VAVAIRLALLEANRSVALPVKLLAGQDRPQS
jgi:hypothetical protein